jgi:hypothetical protein
MKGVGEGQRRLKGVGGGQNACGAGERATTLEKGGRGGSRRCADAEVERHVSIGGAHDAGRDEEMGLGQSKCESKSVRARAQEQEQEKEQAQEPESKKQEQNAKTLEFKKNQRDSVCVMSFPPTPSTQIIRIQNHKLGMLGSPLGAWHKRLGTEPP